MLQGYTPSVNILGLVNNDDDETCLSSIDTGLQNTGV